MTSEIKDKNGEPIKEGDHVFARSRGGRHEGQVDKIVTSKEEADKEGVKHPPKVRVSDIIQHGHRSRTVKTAFCWFANISIGPFH
jgi:hypothetical protein